MNVSNLRDPAFKNYYPEQRVSKQSVKSSSLETAREMITQAGAVMKERVGNRNFFEGDRVIRHEAPSESQSGTISRSISLNEKRIRKGIFIQKRLSNIYDCLVRIVFYPGLELGFNHEGSLCVRLIENKEVSSEEIQKVIEYICKVVNSAISNDILIFFNSDGHIISLKIIDTMMEKKYPHCSHSLIKDLKRRLVECFEENQSFARKLLLEDEPKYINRLSRLKLPKASLRKFSPQELLFVKLIQRIYPISESNLTSDKDGVLLVVPFNLMVSFYKKHMRADQLHQMISHLVNLPEKYMPYLQKLYALGFLSRIRSMREGEWILPDIKLLDEFAQDSQLSRLCLEFKQMQGEEDVFSFYEQKGIVVEDEIARFCASGKLGGESKKSFIENIAKDLKAVAASMFCSLSYDRCLELIKSNWPGELVNYHNKLTLYFTKQLIDSPNNKKSIKIFYRKYLLFLNICNASLFHHDFFSAFGIYCALQSLEVAKKLQLVKSLKHSGEILTISQHLDQTFSANGNFANLNHQFYECVKNSVFHIPPFQLLLQRIEHRREEMQGVSACDGVFDYPMLEAESYEIGSIHLIFDQIRYHFSLLKHEINSNIGYCIFSS